MSNRYADNQIVFNTREFGKGWQEEETYVNRHFIAGTNFEIRIVCDSKRFKVGVVIKFKSETNSIQ